MGEGKGVEPQLSAKSPESFVQGFDSLMVLGATWRVGA